MDKNEILDIISEAVLAVDKSRNFELGDKLFDVIIALRQEWNMSEEE